ncbi:RNA pseudouridylate synthase domain-containing protein 2-like [Centruroides sculpturatus]|uniref:RNA pseudouridylate synthase domain-containing protein 2-like n=1 Tax=Centruroides sculpturatus TaxID=218467 RepID=UPI000C6E3F4F|nr:RNA pseudouridylate synthase domain-containing protein 2-like [Centruroides sculpturatus]
MRDRQVQKEYLCRVEGNFMEGETICKEPILMYRNAGICLVDPNGKKCLTKFVKLSFNGKSSVVLCKPLTGRTHQIRVHLQYLGHPIINDPLYNTDWYGPYKGKACNYGKSKKELIEDLVFKRISRFWKTEPSEFSRKTDENVSASQPVKISQLPSLSHYINLEEYLNLLKVYQFDVRKLTRDPTCKNCLHINTDPKPDELMMFLHAYEYKGRDWNFRTQIPNWAKKDWMDN